MYYATALPAQKIKTKAKYSIWHLNIVLLFAVLIFGVAYFIEINSLSTKGYKIKQLEQKIKTLEMENKHLEVQASNLQSISRVQEQAIELNFVPIGNATYLKDSDFALK
ncbi:MAG: hypothetical protein HYV13_04365 [Candidatus Doudnabacteria bacterium]|nr:hypothetical protein [Candidatus Doudnabacteria bacterium]